QAVIGGFVDAYAGSSTILPMVQSGQLRVLVTWGKQRSSIYPGVPTLNELKSDIAPSYAPFGIAGPKDLPADVLEKLTKTFKEIIDSEEFRATLQRYGQEPVYMSGEEYQEYARKTFAQEAEIVKSLGLAGN